MGYLISAKGSISVPVINNSLVAYKCKEKDDSNNLSEIINTNNINFNKLKKEKIVINCQKQNLQLNDDIYSKKT